MFLESISLKKALPQTLPIAFFIARTPRPLYHDNGANQCPSCGHSHWYVGRSSAECAFCGAALALSHVAAQPMEPRFTSHCSNSIKHRLLA